MARHIVCDEEEISDGDRFLVELEGKDIGVFKLDGEYYAYVDWCIHQGGPCCEGEVSGSVDASFDPETLEVTLEWSREGEILLCPWHGWEYDLRTGECRSRKGKLVSYPVEVEDGAVVVDM
ncbi:MAG: Rieske (2Fe-2S) protein [Halapricum sp.]